MSAPELEPHCGSWVVTCMVTGESLFETFDKKLADQCSEQQNLKVWTAAQWLAHINKCTKDESRGQNK